MKNRIHWDETVPAVAPLVAARARLLREPGGDIGWHVLADPEETSSARSPNEDDPPALAEHPRRLRRLPRCHGFRPAHCRAIRHSRPPARTPPMAAGPQVPDRQAHPARSRGRCAARGPSSPRTWRSSPPAPRKPHSRTTRARRHARLDEARLQGEPVRWRRAAAAAGRCCRWNSLGADGAQADVQLLGDLGVGPALRDQGDEFPFARAELAPSVRRLGLSARRRPAGQQTRRRWRGSWPRRVLRRRASGRVPALARPSASAPGDAARLDDLFQGVSGRRRSASA